MVETLVEVRKTMTATAEGFALQASVMLEPWRARQRVVSLHAKSLAASSDDALRAVVKERASKKELSPEDVWHLMGSSLYGDDGSRRLHQALLLRVPEWSVRLNVANWHIFEQSSNAGGGAHDLTPYAHLIDAFTWPLYPAHQDFIAINASMLQRYQEFQAAAPAGGGSPPGTWRPPQFAKSKPLVGAAGPQEVTGGGYLRLMTPNANGEWVVTGAMDSTELEQELAQMKAAMQTLLRQQPKAHPHSDRGRGGNQQQQRGRGGWYADPQVNHGGKYRGRGHGSVRGGGDSGEGEDWRSSNDDQAARSKGQKEGGQ